jgi:hypothetical protein
LVEFSNKKTVSQLKIEALTSCQKFVFQIIQKKKSPLETPNNTLAEFLSPLLKASFFTRCFFLPVNEAVKPATLNKLIFYSLE